MKVKSLIKEVYTSPIGEIEILSNDKGLVSIGFAWAEDPEPLGSGVDEYIDICNPCNDNASYGVFVAEQLAEYFSGKRQEFVLNFDFQKGTAFQRSVWEEMLRIPFGETRTYGEIAKIIGKPNAARAVGMACNQNPICIIVPCHRVVGSGGELTGYAGGLLKKQWLLKHENGI